MKFVRQIFPLFFCLFAGVIYLYTAPPSMLWQDAGSMVVAAKTFGVSIPPAPVYVFLGHFFTLLPWGSDIFRLQVFSVFLAVLSLFLLYKVTFAIIVSLIRDKKQQRNEKKMNLAALFGLVAFAFSYEFWSQAQNPERFIFICFIELLIFYLIFRFASSLKFVSLFAAIVFIFGLALGIDPVLISVFPSLLFVLWCKRSILHKKAILMYGIIGVISLGIVLSYLPIASLHNPFLNYKRPTDPERILTLITGQGVNVYNPEIDHMNGFTGSPDVFLSSSWHFLEMIWLSFTPLLIPFILIGWWYLWKKQKFFFWVLSLGIISNFLLSAIYFSGNQDSWYLVSHTIFAIFASVGYFWLLKKFQNKWYVLVLFFVAFSPLISWWQNLNRQEWQITDDYITNLYHPIDSPAILVGYGDLFVQSTVYAYEITGRKDVIPVVGNFLGIVEPYRENLQKTTPLLIPNKNLVVFTSPEDYSHFMNEFFALNLPKYKIYVTNSYLASIHKFLRTSDNKQTFHLDTNRFTFVPAGMLQEVVATGNVVDPDPEDFLYYFSNDLSDQRPFFLERSYTNELENMLSEYAYSYVVLGDYFSKKGKYAEAGLFYQKAYTLKPNDMYYLNKLGSFYASRNQYEDAYFYYKEAYALNSADPMTLYNLAVIDMKLQNKSEAILLLERALELSKKNNDTEMIDKITNSLQFIETQ